MAEDDFKVAIETIKSLSKFLHETQCNQTAFCSQWGRPLLTIKRMQV